MRGRARPGSGGGLETVEVKRRLEAAAAPVNRTAEIDRTIVAAILVCAWIDENERGFWR